MKTLSEKNSRFLRTFVNDLSVGKSKYFRIGQQLVIKITLISRVWHSAGIREHKYKLEYFLEMRKHIPQVFLCRFEYESSDLNKPCRGLFAAHKLVLSPKHKIIAMNFLKADTLRFDPDISAYICDLADAWMDIYRSLAAPATSRRRRRKVRYQG